MPRRVASEHWADLFKSIDGIACTWLLRHWPRSRANGSRSVTPDVGNARLFAREHISLDGLAQRASQLAGEGRTTVRVAIDGRAGGVIAIADARRETPKDAVAALHKLGVRAVMLTGDSRATAERVAAEVGIEEVIAEVLPGDKAGKVTELQQQGRKAAMVGDGVNDAPRTRAGRRRHRDRDRHRRRRRDSRRRADALRPLDVAAAITIGRGTRRKERQNLAWAIGYNSIAIPIAAGALEPVGFTLRPEIAGISCPARASSSRSTPSRSDDCGFPTNHTSRP